MGNYGIKVSQAGYDVTTAAKERLVFSSQYDTLKIFMSGGGSVSVPLDADVWTPGTTTVEITHSLGYKPAFICFSSTPWGGNDELSPYAYKSIGVPHNIPNYGVDTTKLYLTFYNADPASDITVYYRYHIYYNELS